jgi:hypothetical protein
MASGRLCGIAHIGNGQTIVGHIIFAKIQVGAAPIATLARCLTVLREAEQMYPDGGAIGIDEVAPVILFLVPYLIHTQAPEHRYGKSDIRTASDARTKFVPKRQRHRDVRM